MPHAKATLVLANSMLLQRNVVNLQLLWNVADLILSLPATYHVRQSALISVAVSSPCSGREPEQQSTIALGFRELQSNLYWEKLHPSSTKVYHHSEVSGFASEEHFAEPGYSMNLHFWLACEVSFPQNSFASFLTASSEHTHENQECIREHG
jgi:hypothetical protein